MDNLDNLRKAVQSTSKHSKSFELLKADEREQVLNWIKELQTAQTLTNNTINSYKSYITKALLKVRKGEKLTNDEKSATRKFLSFLDKQDKQD